MHFKHALTASALAIVVALTGCSSDPDTDGNNGPGSASQAAFNTADVEFAQQMIPHHRQAVEMAQLVKERAGSARVRQLANQISAAQEPEIETMSGWLRNGVSPCPRRCPAGVTAATVRWARRCPG